MESLNGGDQQSCLELVSSRASYTEIGHRSCFKSLEILMEVHPITESLVLLRIQMLESITEQSQI